LDTSRNTNREDTIKTEKICIKGKDRVFRFC